MLSTGDPYAVVLLRDRGCVYINDEDLAVMFSEESGYLSAVNRIQKWSVRAILYSFVEDTFFKLTTENTENTEEEKREFYKS